jgi:hypothetical protein
MYKTKIRVNKEDINKRIIDKKGVNMANYSREFERILSEEWN